MVARWIEKVGHMNNRRFPRLLLEAWIPHACRNSRAGRAQHSIRHMSTNVLYRNWAIQIIKTFSCLMVENDSCSQQKYLLIKQNIFFITSRPKAVNLKARF